MSEREPKIFEIHEIKAPKTSKFLATEHERLKEKYTHCGLIADNVARLLLEDGLTPQIEIVYEEVRDGNGNTVVKSFLPEIYRGKMDPWHGHTVCCTESHVFDPIIGRPVLKPEYSRLAFGENIKMKPSVPPEKIKKHLGIIGQYP